jgi:hypothetical protein
MPGGDSHTFDSFECAIHALAHCASMAGAEGVSDRA